MEENTDYRMELVKKKAGFANYKNYCAVNAVSNISVASIPVLNEHPNKYQQLTSPCFVLINVIRLMALFFSSL